MDLSQLERLVLEHVASPNYRPVKPRVFAKHLGLPRESITELKRVIKRLVKQERLSYGPKHLVLAPGASAQKLPKTIEGVFQRTKGGFGFVRPINAPATAAEDIFVPAKKTRDAATGDIVRVRLKQGSPGAPRDRGTRGRSAGGRSPVRPTTAAAEGGEQATSQRLAGEIVEVLQRECNQFVGTYFEAEGAGFVRVDGRLFAQPIYVGDPGAKNARPNDKVVLEMVRFPSHTRLGEGVILEVLGDRNAPGVDTLMVIREFNLPGDFPEDVLEDARRQAMQFDGKHGADRVDLTPHTVITIDPKDARDFDDAISLEKLDNGHWRLGVHIADVSHFVRPRSPLDREARERGTSVYLPDRVIPMLPEVISNNLASLQPNRLRYARTALIEFTPDGARVATDTYKSAIKSKRRFTYEEIDQYLADRPQWRSKLPQEVHALLDRMHELAMILRRRRLERGAIELTMPEIKLDLDQQGKVAGARSVEHTESHQIIEEFMLAANEAVAERLHDSGITFLRRIHENPDPRKLKTLTEFVRQMRIEVDSLESRFEIKRILAAVAGRPEQPAVNYAVLRSMQKAIYSPQETGHYALASHCYCHFTSPIRRYPDLTIHRALDLLDQGKSPPQAFDAILALGEHCSEREQRAEQAERELTKVKLLNYLSTRIGEKMRVVVTGVEPYGLFAQGIELPAEGLLHVTAMMDDHYDYDSTAQTLTGRRAGNAFRLGDTLEVEIVRVDTDARELDFRFAGRWSAAKQPAAAESRGKIKSTRHEKQRPATGARKKQRLGGSETGGARRKKRRRR